MKPRSMFRPVRRTPYLVTHIDPLMSGNKLALDRDLQQPDPGPFFGRTSDQGIERFPDTAGEELSRGRFPYLTLHPLGRIFLLGAMRR